MACASFPLHTRKNEAILAGWEAVGSAFPSAARPPSIRVFQHTAGRASRGSKSSITDRHRPRAGRRLHGFGDRWSPPLTTSTTPSSDLPRKTCLDEFKNLGVG
nr:hypothetical protein [uncultured bacterium]